MCDIPTKNIDALGLSMMNISLRILSAIKGSDKSLSMETAAHPSDPSERMALLLVTDATRVPSKDDLSIKLSSERDPNAKTWISISLAGNQHPVELYSDDHLPKIEQLVRSML